MLNLELAHHTAALDNRRGPAAPDENRARLARAYNEVRRETERRAAPLSPEDQMLQSMTEASPTKWHLAHTSWFYERFVLIEHAHDYRRFDASFDHIFNSYYNQIGTQHRRAERGLISRPDHRQVTDYRSHVDIAIRDLIATADIEVMQKIAPLIEIGLHHEQQHQELILTDIKHAFAQHPAAPAYQNFQPPRQEAMPLTWLEFAGGKAEIGHSGDGFSFDNETPRHNVWLRPFQIANRPISNGEFAAFIADKGYQKAELWLSDGWDWLSAHQRAAPLYWRKHDAEWNEFTLYGEVTLNPAAPACHLTFYEVSAYAVWAGKRLPTEAEWEFAAAAHGIGAVEPGLHPHFGKADDGSLLSGGVWEWTQSAYTAYPGYRPLAGALGEYNGKFMCNQLVLRGGSCATPRVHSRLTYRNFFPAAAAWQFTGARLADDL